MDDIVKAALLKWPNVPACTGWLALDARGDWYMRDERVQREGPFPAVKGSRIEHDKLREFIERNYEADERGAWYFQNGPQRVYVELEAAPWVLGVMREGGAEGKARWRVDTHTGRVVSRVQAAWLDEHGRLLLDTNLGLGLVRSLDMDTAADVVASGVWMLEDVDHRSLVDRHRLILSPHTNA
jgi:Protein of unknown function (DUF2946)